MDYKLGLLQWRHRFAFTVHFAAFAFLLGFAIDRSGNDLSVYDRQFWINTDDYSYSEPRRWLYRCFYVYTFINRTSCYDDDKRFFVEVPPNKINVNILAVALFYVLWSASLHVCASLVPQYTRVLRWTDYSVTAPVMLLATGLAFGAQSVTALVFMPLLLGVLLIIACFVEQEATFPEFIAKNGVVSTVIKWTESESKFIPFFDISLRRQLLIVFILLAYIPTVLPLLLASKSITEEKGDLDEVTGTGTAPDYVFIFTILTIMLFNSFAIVFVINLFKPIDREKWYIYLSMLSKTALHLFLGLAVIGQSNFVNVGEASSEKADMDIITNALIGCICLVIGLFLPTVFLSNVYKYFHQDQWKQYVKDQSVQIMESLLNDDS
ncbi:MAG: hypothetical protein CL678_11805 [Bdellovibrionaceae bacterium]|nr:hypothetical protein [Pseudobdellovibrionaceae bacterium]|tara:strand:- start:998 stop:2137 length:1140 start_codon:yes stop_codon:yes gene_type:complete